MKSIIKILLSMFLIGCGSKKFMEFLNSTGDSFVESVELGKKAKAKMFECDFERICFYVELKKLLEKECKDYERFDMVSYKECIIFNERQFKEIYKLNKQVLGL